MFRRFTLITGVVVAAFGCGALSTAAAKSEDWSDTQGNRFRGEPAEVLGPLALFRTAPTMGRRLPLHLLAPADCVRFYEQVHLHPARADDWAQAKGAISEELAGNVLRLDGDRLISADLKGRPEPEFFILFFASNSEGKSWEMIGPGASPGPTRAVRAIVKN